MTELTDTEREALVSTLVATDPDPCDPINYDASGYYRAFADAILASDWLVAREAAAVEAALAPVRALADEHERSCNPAPYTSERALIERLRAVLPPAPTEGES